MAPNKKQHIAAAQGIADAVGELARGVFDVRGAHQLSVHPFPQSPASDSLQAELNANQP